MILVATNTEMTQLASLLLEKYKTENSIGNSCCCDLFLVTKDSSSVTFSGAGSKQNPLIANVIISPDASNALTQRSNGLYVTAGGGSGTITGANNGLTVSGGNTIQFGQDIGAVGNPSILLSSREIYVPIGMDISLVRDISGYSPLYPTVRTTIGMGIIKIDAVDGGTLHINIQDYTNIYGDSFPSIDYYANNVLQAFSGVHWTIPDKHFDMVDLRGSLTYATVQSGGVTTQQWSANGDIYIGMMGTKKVVLGRGGTPGTAAVNITPTIVGAAQLRYEGSSLTIVPSSPNDGDSWTANNHLYIRLNGITYQLDQQVTATPTLQQVLTAGSTLTTNNTIILGTTSLTLSSSATTATTTSSSIVETFNSLTSGTGHYISSSSQTFGVLLHVAMTGTVGAGKEGVRVTSSGTNASNNITTIGYESNINNSGTGSINYGYYSNINNADNNYGFYVDNGIGSGTSTGYFAFLTSGNNQVGASFTASGGTGTNYALKTNGGKVLFNFNSADIGTTTISSFVLTHNTITSDTIQYISSTSLSSGKLLDLSISGTAGANGQTGINISLSGTNSSSAQSTFGLIIHNTHSGSGTNYGGYFVAQGGTNNYAILVPSTGGKVSINNDTPLANSLDVLPTNTTSTTTSSGVVISNPALTSGTLVYMNSSGSAALTNQTILNIISSGTNSSSNQTTYGLRVSNTHAGTGAINYAASFDRGKVGFGTSGTETGILVLNSAGNNAISLQAPTSGLTSYTLTLPATAGTNNYVLRSDGSGITNWIDVNTLVSGFTLNNGSGTTSGGTFIDWTGTLNADVNIDGGNIYQINFDNLISYRTGNSTYTGGIFGFDNISPIVWMGDYNNGVPQNLGNFFKADLSAGTLTINAVGTRTIEIYSKAIAVGAAAIGWVWTLQNNTTGASEWAVLPTSVASIVGTANRIDITGTSTIPIINISSTYVGQSSITTLGTITTGTWNATTIDTGHGGTGFSSYTVGDLLSASTTSALSKINAVAAGSYLRSAGTSTLPIWSTLILPNNATVNQIVYATATDTYGSSSRLTFNGSTFTQTSTNSTAVTTASISVITANSLSSGTGEYIASSSLTSGKMIDVQVTGTGGLTNQTGVNISLSGANSNASQTTYGLDVSNTHTGTSTNVAARFTASGGSNNTAAIFSGRAAFGGVTAPFADIDVGNGSIAAGSLTITTSAGSNANGNFSVANTSLLGTNTGTIYQILGSTNMDARVYVGGTGVTAVGVGRPYGSLVVGAAAVPEAASGNHPLIASLILIPPIITGAAATVTKTATLYIDDAPTCTVTDANYAFYIRNGNIMFLNGNITLGTAGNKLVITEGTDGRVGQVALIAGTKAITINGLTTSSRAFITLVTPSGVTLTTTYQAVCTANTLTIQANVAAGTINASDISTVNYFIIN